MTDISTVGPKELIKCQADIKSWVFWKRGWHLKNFFPPSLPNHTNRAKAPEMTKAASSHAQEKVKLQRGHRARNPHRLAFSEHCPWPYRFSPWSWWLSLQSCSPPVGCQQRAAAESPVHSSPPGISQGDPKQELILKRQTQKKLCLGAECVWL